MLRGGALGRGGATMIKVSKPEQDLRFDVPVIGLLTLDTAKQAGLSCIGVETGKTLLLDRPAVLQRANEQKISIYGLES
jgi:DUF1009 family protein